METHVQPSAKLRDWPDRPPELDAEPLLDRLGSEARCRDWVIFLAGYPSRLPDYLALNTASGDVRRYVDVNRRVVEDDLLEIRRAPLSAQDRTRWGNPEPRELAKRFSVARYLEDPPDSFAQLGDGNLRVYALPVVNPPFGLRYDSSQSSARPPESVMLDYKNDDESVSLSLNSSDWLYGRDIVSSSGDVQSAGPRRSLYDRLRGDLVADDGSVMPARTFHLDGRDFDGAVFESAERPDAPRFVFRTPELTVHGSARGLTGDDVMGVLSQMVATNDHPEVISAMRSRAEARSKARNPAPAPVYKAADRSSSAFTRLAAIQPLLVARYPGAVLTALHGSGDLLAQDGTARLWTIAIWKPLSDEDRAQLNSSLPGGDDTPTGRVVVGSRGFIRVTALADNADSRWNGAVASIEESSGKDRPGLAPLVQAVKLGLLDSTEVVTVADKAGGGAFRERTAGSLSRIALGLQADEASFDLPTGFPTSPQAPVRPLWGLRYDAADRSSKLLVIIDAQTGATVFSGS